MSFVIDVCLKRVLCMYVHKYIHLEADIFCLFVDSLTGGRKRILELLKGRAPLCQRVKESEIHTCKVLLELIYRLMRSTHSILNHAR